MSGICSDHFCCVHVLRTLAINSIGWWNQQQTTSRIQYLQRIVTPEIHSEDLKELKLPIAWIFQKVPIE
jgi:hypothetical protein